MRTVARRIAKLEDQFGTAAGKPQLLLVAVTTKTWEGLWRDSDAPSPTRLPRGGLIGRTAPRHVHGHNDQPALHLREGVRRVFRNHRVIALGNSPWRSAFQL